jgi:hypothetical protein
MSPAFLFSTAPRRLQRLREMSLAEVATRARQKASSWIDRTRTSPPVWPSPDRVLAQRAPALARDEAAPRFRDDICRRFFVGATGANSAMAMRRQFPGDAAALISTADRMAAGRFDLLGYENLSFGDPVDWHWDPVADQRAPICHWSLIDPLDYATVGDNKVIWELNRHQWLVTLGQAYVLTGDIRYAVAAGQAIDGWLDANPPGIGLNWASSLELAYRIVAWSWALALLRESVFLSPDRFARMAAAVWAQARHVERYLSVYFSPNTHLTGEALGLFYAGVLFPEFADAERWRTTGRTILETEIDRQVLDDGVNFEQATCYQRYTLEIYLHLAMLAARNDIALDPKVHAGIERTADFLAAITVDGIMPQIGDEDGGWLLPLVRRTADDSRGALASAAAWLGHPFDRYGIRPAAEVLWLIGSCAEPPSAAADAAGSRAFPHGGYVVMRGAADDGHQLLFDVGPIGCPNSSGHGHADLLSVQCRADGDSYLVDPGTYCYTPEPSWRNHFRGTAAHNTVTIDGHEQADPDGPFSWHERPAARLRAWRSTSLFDLADGDHDAYGHLDDPVTHRRRVLFVKAGYWIIVDDLIGTAEHTADVRYQLSPRDVIRGPLPWFLAAGTHGHGLWIGAFSEVPLGTSVRAGEVDPIEGWVSCSYGRRRPAPVVVYRAAGRFPVRIVTVLWPVKTVDGVPGIHVRRSKRDFSIEIPDHGHIVTIDEQTVGLDACD